MKFTLKTAGVRIDKNAACAVSLVADFTIGVKRRELSMALGGALEQQAQLQAVCLGLLSIIPKFRKQPLELQVDAHAFAVLNGVESEDNKKQVSRVRELAKLFPALELVCMQDDQVLQLAKTAATTQQNWDSGSYE